MGNTAPVSYEARTAYPSWAPGFIPGFMLLIFSVLCVVFLLCLSLFCVLSPILHVSLVCPSLIAPSILFNIYWTQLSFTPPKWIPLVVTDMTILFSITEYWCIVLHHDKMSELPNRIGEDFISLFNLYLIHFVCLIGK